MSYRFYTYLWLDDAGVPYYVGKSHQTSRRRGRAFRRGCPPENHILVEYHDSEAAAFIAEEFLIDFYGRRDLGTGPLLNCARGGKGYRGWSTEARDRRSGYIREHPLPYDPNTHSALMTGRGNPMYGKRRLFSDTWTQNLSEGKTGHIVSGETRQKMSEITRRRWAMRDSTRCYRGHEMTPANTNIGKSGSRFCLQCREINHKLANARNREKRMAKQ